MKSKEVKLTLQGLDCANCANKIEKRVNDLEEVKEAVLNFTSLTLTIELNNEDKKEEVVTKTKEIINILEPHVKVINKVTKLKKTANMCTDCGDDNHNSHRGHDHENNNHDSNNDEGGNDHHGHGDHNNEEDHAGHYHGHVHSKLVFLKDNIALFI